MKTLLAIKTDKSLKETAQEIAHEIGVPLSTVINSFLKQFVRDRQVVFSATYNPSPYLRSIIEASEDERKIVTKKTVKGVGCLVKSLSS